MFAIGNEEIEKMPVLGKSVFCKTCNKRHIIKYGETVNPDGTKSQSKTLAFVKCCGTDYLVGINGKNITSR